LHPVYLHHLIQLNLIFQKLATKKRQIS
jgi:hypothetical protein